MAYTQQLLSTNENILIERRQHWIGLVGPFFSMIIRIAFIGLLVALLSSAEVPGALGILRRVGFVQALEAVTNEIPRTWIVLAGLALIALTLLGYVNQLVLWLNKTYVLTSRRVIQITGVLSKRSFDSSLEKINDINLTQSFFGRLLGYGTLSIMTASEIGFSSMHNLADPAGFKRAMLDAKNHLGDGTSPMVQPSTGNAQPALSLQERLTRLDQLKSQGVISAEEFAARRSEILKEL